jgi:hypothetical protein
VEIDTDRVSSEFGDSVKLRESSIHSDFWCNGEEIQGRVHSEALTRKAQESEKNKDETVRAADNLAMGLHRFLRTF